LSASALRPVARLFVVVLRDPQGHAFRRPERRPRRHRPNPLPRHERAPGRGHRRYAARAGSVAALPVNIMPLSIPTISRRLRREYGPGELGEPLPPLDELIATILSQNTSDRNSDAAFAELKKRLPTWEAVRTAPLSRIVRAIRSGGLARQKAPRIRAV